MSDFTRFPTQEEIICFIDEQYETTKFINTRLATLDEPPIFQQQITILEKEIQRMEKHQERMERAIGDAKRKIDKWMAPKIIKHVLQPSYTYVNKSTLLSDRHLVSARSPSTTSKQNKKKPRAPSDSHVTESTQPIQVNNKSKRGGPQTSKKEREKETFGQKVVRQFSKLFGKDKDKERDKKKDVNSTTRSAFGHPTPHVGVLADQIMLAQPSSQISDSEQKAAPSKVLSPSLKSPIRKKPSNRKKTSNKKTSPRKQNSKTKEKIISVRKKLSDQISQQRKLSNKNEKQKTTQEKSSVSSHKKYTSARRHPHQRKESK